jgi:hypothetical protein
MSTREVQQQVHSAGRYLAVGSSEALSDELSEIVVGTPQRRSPAEVVERGLSTAGASFVRPPGPGYPSLRVEKVPLQYGFSK